MLWTKRKRSRSPIDVSSISMSCRCGNSFPDGYPFTFDQAEATVSNDNSASNEVARHPWATNEATGECAD
jgi:hypothetical protein